MSSECLDKFLVSVLTDIGVPTDTIICMQSQADAALTAYDEATPINVIDIGNKYYDCTSNVLKNKAGSATGSIISSVIIACVVTIILAILIIILIISQVGFRRIASVLITIIIYIIILLFIGYVTSNTFVTIVDNTEDDLKVCKTQAITSIKDFETQQKEAINTALCAFANTPCPPALLNL